MTSDDSLHNLTPGQRECYEPNEFPLQYYTNYSYSNCYDECKLELGYEKFDCIPWSKPSIYSK